MGVPATSFILLGLSVKHKYINSLAQKRPLEGQSDVPGKKHKSDEAGQLVSSDSSSSSIAISSIANSITKTHISPQHVKSQHQSPWCNSSSGLELTSPIPTKRAPKRHKEEPNDEDKENLRKELGFEYSPWDDNLDRDQKAEVTLALWTRELRRRERYVPDYGPEKMKAYGIEHERNIKFSMRAYEQFRCLEMNVGYTAWTEDKHDEFDRHQNRNLEPLGST